MATDIFSGWLLDLKTFIGHFAVSLEMRYLFFYMSVKVYCVAGLLFVSFFFFFFFFLYLVNKFVLLLLPPKPLRDSIFNSNIQIKCTTIEKITSEN